MAQILSDSLPADVVVAPKGFLAYVGDDINVSPGRYLTAVILLVVTIALLNVYPKIDSREPPALKPTIPVIGHLIGLLKYQNSYHKILLDKYHRKVATLPILNGRLYVMWDPVMVQMAYRNKKLNFLPFVLEFAHKELAMRPEVFKILQDTDVVPEVFTQNRPSMSGAHLHATNARALNFISGRLEGMGAGGKTLEIPNLYLWVQELMTVATTEALFGAENPFNKNPGLVKDIWSFDTGLPFILLGFLPRITAREACNARTRIHAALGAHYLANKDQADEASQLIKARSRAFQKYGLTNKETGEAEIAAVHVAVANSIPTEFWFIIHVFSRPDLVRRLREEVMPLAQHGNDGLVTIDVTTFEERCPFFVSSYRETIRITNQTVGQRRVMEDTTVSDGQGNTYLLKKGENLQMSSMSMHLLESVWGEDALEFRADRFLQDPDRQNGEAEKAKRSAYVPFGGGTHLCPGRSLAFAENLGFVAALLLGYEVSSLSDRSAPPVVPNLRPCSFFEAAAKPVNNGNGCGAQLWRREGWESTRWRFVS